MHEGTPVAFATINALTYDQAQPREVDVSLQYQNATSNTVQVKRPFAGSQWLTCDWIVRDPEGVPVQAFEPLFDNSCSFLYPSKEHQCTHTFYDSQDRPEAVLYPDHTWSKMILFMKPGVLCFTIRTI